MYEGETMSAQKKLVSLSMNQKLEILKSQTMFAVFTEFDVVKLFSDNECFLLLSVAI